jgi:hypothetical protein
MTQKVHGAAYPGIWVEKQVAFVKLTFSRNIAALPASALTVLGTSTAAGVGTVADSSFGVVESVIVQALKAVEQKATVLGVSKLYQDEGSPSKYNVDVMLGYAEGWFSNAAGLIAAAQPVLNAQAVVTTAGAAPTNVVGQLVSVKNDAVTYDVEFAAFSNLPVATFAGGFLADGPGATSGATPTNSPTGTSGFYPV